MSHQQGNRGRGRGDYRGRGRGDHQDGGRRGFESDNRGRGRGDHQDGSRRGFESDNRGRGRGDYHGPRQDFSGGTRGRGRGNSSGDQERRFPSGSDDRGRGRGPGSFGGPGNFAGAPGPSQDVKMTDAVEHTQIVRQKLTPGTLGKTVKLLANFYQFMISDIIVYHYDVNITKSQKKIKPTDQPKSAASSAGDASKTDPVELFIKKFSPEIFAKFKDDHPEIFTNVHYIYDEYKNLYTVKELKLPAEEFVQKVNINGKMDFFKIKIRHVEAIDLSEASLYYEGRVSEVSERTISVLEIIFRSLFTKAGYVFYQRKFFDLEKSERPRTDPRNQKIKIHEFVRGCMNSVRMTEVGLAMNVHLKTTCIISKSYVKLDQFVSGLLQLQGPKQLAGLMSDRGLNRWHLSTIGKMVRHLDIYTMHTGTKMYFKVNYILNQTPKQNTFTDKDGKIVSNFDYFKQRYNKNLENFPMVQTTKQRVILPLEMCFLKDKQFLSNAKIDADMQAELLTASTHKPNIYFNHANEIVKRVGDVDQNHRKAFGFESLCLKPMALTGRVIPSPSMKCSGMNDKLYKPLPPMVWAFYCFDDSIRDEELKFFISEMRKESVSCGLSLNEPRDIKVKRISTLNDVKTICHEIMADPKLKNLDLLFCGFPKRHNIIQQTEEIYNFVKHQFDQQFGIITQGVKSDNIRRTPRGYFKNFLLKVNGKIGGQNTVIDPAVLGSIAKVNPARTMVVGVDVYHPGPTDQVKSSIAAAIGSYDSMFTKYSASIRVQKKDDKDKDREMIKQINEMFKELLLEYKKQNKGQTPENIFVFRDGVSEGQLEKLKTVEIPLIEKAMVEVIGKKVKLSLLVVQKRHHTRFVLAEANTSGKYPTFNVSPGTVVDQFIVDPQHEEFYLASHASPLGTTKPSKYIKIRDDLKLTTNELQTFCFFNCHQCIRTRQSISIPTPIRYADLCAYRSSLHIRAQHEERSQTGTEEEWERKVIATLNREIKVNDKIKIQMYYG